ncbi:hypothetical protein E4T56_gene18166 [Termitomyces sp. T112]|nr:hypothetical protein E4T56_gene18166 [Termitomyces sp. T112]
MHTRVGEERPGAKVCKSAYIRLPTCEETISDNSVQPSHVWLWARLPDSSAYLKRAQDLSLLNRDVPIT